MSIIAGFVVPHAPILVKEVGKGEENKVIKTVESYKAVAKDIAKLKPDTIIISSPHAEAYSDYFSIAGTKTGYGSLANFNAPEVMINVNYDTELTDLIEKLSQEISFPAGKLGENSRTDFSSDHGSLVPLYFINQEYKNYRLVRLGLSGLSIAEHYRMGMIIQKAVEALGRNAVYVASGDLSHCQNKDGPYGFKPCGPQYDKMIMDTLEKADFRGLLNYDPDFLDEAEVCGHDSFAIMAGAFDRKAVETKVLSHENTFGIGYGVVEYFVKGDDVNRNFYDQYLDDRKELMEKKSKKADIFASLARRAINYYILNNKPLPLDASIPLELLNQKAGAFVSIHEDQRLRGCIGTIQPIYPNLAEEIIHNACEASTRDPRFDPILPKELPYLDISVDVLSPFEAISSKKELDPKKYGVIVMNSGREGLLLPDLEGVDTVDQQIKIAKRKAGIGDDEEVKLFRFTSRRHV
jgi:AmmeMemoRadiSam system protein A/AmmeMemoRadiSam system protein B